jgi:peptidoglycan/xylan/chitin deacetylase (PgdA/CDA1 family)
MRDDPILFTVDVETDWGEDRRRGIEEALPRLLEILDRHRARATFFVVGELIESFRSVMSPSSAHEVASHGMTHTLLTRLPDERIDFEVRESKAALERVGFEVSGFRAPFLKKPKGFNVRLERSGYRYDSSGGSVYVSPANLARDFIAPANGAGVHQVGTSALRDGLTPFSLTWLRIFHPLGLRMVPGRTAVFYCHLHELLPPPGGWRGLPLFLRKVHARNTGGPAWRIVEALLESGRRIITCRDYLEETA